MSRTGLGGNERAIAKSETSKQIVTPLITQHRNVANAQWKGLRGTAEKLAMGDDSGTEQSTKAQKAPKKKTADSKNAKQVQKGAKDPKKDPKKPGRSSK